MAKKSNTEEVQVKDLYVVTEENITELCELIPTCRISLDKPGVVFNTESGKHYAHVGSTIEFDGTEWKVSL